MTIISPSLAQRHETLAVRLDAILAQLSPVARRRPEGRVPPAVREQVARLLFDARPFGGETTEALPPKGSAPPATTESWAALIAALAEARAALETFETVHSAWDAALQCRVWQVPGEPLPIARLRARGALRPAAVNARESAATRLKVTTRIDALIVTAYARGFADATAGREANPLSATLAAREAQLNQG